MTQQYPWENIRNAADFYNVAVGVRSAAHNIRVSLSAVKVALEGLTQAIQNVKNGNPGRNRKSPEQIIDDVLNIFTAASNGINYEFDILERCAKALYDALHSSGFNEVQGADKLRELVHGIKTHVLSISNDIKEALNKLVAYQRMPSQTNNISQAHIKCEAALRTINIDLTNAITELIGLLRVTH